MDDAWKDGARKAKSEYADWAQQFTGCTWLAEVGNHAAKPLLAQEDIVGQSLHLADVSVFHSDVLTWHNAPKSPAYH